MKISVVLCTRDRPDQLKRCLSSLLKLSPAPFELIVVDNGSVNFTIPKIEYACRTRFFSQPVHGLSYARNLGVSKAEGDVVAFIDDDAVADALWLEAAGRRFEDESIACVTGRVRPLDLRTEWQKKAASTGWYPDSEVALIFEKGSYDPFTTLVGVGCNLFVRRNYFENQKFPEFFGAGSPAGGSEELYLFYRIIQSGMRIVYEPESTVYHEYISDEKQFKRHIARVGVSRVAYLMRFILHEKRQRLNAWKHVIGRLTFGSGVSSIRRSGFTTRAILVGPFAYLYSEFLAYKNHSAAAQRAELIAEFPGKS